MDEKDHLKCSLLCGCLKMPIKGVSAVQIQFLFVTWSSVPKLVGDVLCKDDFNKYSNQ